MHGPLAVQLSLRGERLFGQQFVGKPNQRASNRVSRLILVTGEPHYFPKYGFVPEAEYRLK